MQQNRFFSDFGGGPNGFKQVIIEQPQSQAPPFPDKYNNNVLVLEIANNFPFVQWLMYRHREKILKKVDEYERDWFNFLINSRIDILLYSKGESSKFIDDHYKN